MDLQIPKPKRPNRLKIDLPLPVIMKKDGTIEKIPATFNGFTVVVEDPADMKTIVSMGCFGKGNLSRSFPHFHLNSDKTELIRSRQYNHRKKFKSTSLKKVIVVPDSDNEEIDDYITNLKPEYQIDSSCLSENVCLSLEEAFFLTHAVECLVIKSENEVLEIEQVWKEFCKINKDFPVHYAVYFYFRAKNWVVKPGIKFGGDYLLYKQGPSFFHAAYVVVINIVNPQSGEKQRSMENPSVMGLNRLSETAGKDLIICKVTLPENGIDYKNMQSVLIEELLVRRWLYSQKNS
ncbi:unnamed protein product [Acanthoscelides obtectus]|uniref:tRNA-splicing endonuclease subunit Sen2 n=1 Tax=Acanthoscelides obtectus TaxID=200917 RepID=A0A9P0PKF0_ACAOB|nr:unnamed protein product [Acanthoscelides obtectus]CAK1674977.1 tRNA-splicing endonuclease subunit Sen2 [Acanthoscelides obtectus]